MSIRQGVFAQQTAEAAGMLKGAATGLLPE
jgi:hypothetical protein